ncbi:LysR family transcriptional regulator [Mycolicibacterium baixiangningiae]|uniref:LysR family transcriptional regulator n=1 Tax=Mycolicibacterium baixiangningiae TaxID=2761578 RepID=UPI0018D159BB|nr:LysR family transcriptional regulator [Mycolicibacterium baixiangningiae]
MYPADLTLRQLRCFRAVARTGKFTAAAAELHVSQSALSRTILTMERTLRVELLDRSTHRVALTAAGAELLRVIEPVVDQLRDGMERFATYAAGQSGTVAVATLPSVAAVLLPNMIAAFLADHPGVSFFIIDGAADATQTELTRGSAELAVTTRHGLGDDIAFTPLFKETMFGVARRDHPLAQRKSMTWADFTDTNFIAARRGTSIGRITDACFDRHHVTVKQQFNPSTVATIGGLIRAGIGVSALPSLEIAGFNLTDLACVPIEASDATRILGVAHSTTRSLSPAAASFLTHLKRCSPQHSGVTKLDPPPVKT